MAEEPKIDRGLDEYSQAGSTSIVRELIDFLRYNKKWWLLPIFLVLGLFGVLLALAATGAAPFIYTLF
jgi:hypothetical protein